MARPNVLWILTDQHNYRALRCAGNETVETPNIDRLADDGVFFENAYSPAPVCGPARGAVFSGLYPSHNGMNTNNATFNDDIDLLPELLGQEGYQTALVGKLHYEPKSAPHGFNHKKLHDAMYDCYNPEEPWTSEYVQWLADQRADWDVAQIIKKANEDENAFHERNNLFRFLMGTNWRTEEEHSNTWVADQTIDYLTDHREDPFFLFSSFFGPHQPMRAPGKWADMYDPSDVELPSEFYQDREKKPSAQAKIRHERLFRYYDHHEWPEERYRKVLAAYYGQISMIDEQIGRILDTLERLGIRDETIVIFSSDHGDHAGQLGWFGKGTMYEGSVHVPLIVSDPTAPSGQGERTGHVVNTIDLFETVLERCGVEYDRTTHSRSLVPLLEDPRTSEWADETYSELSTTRMVIEDGYKLIESEFPNGDVVRELYDQTEPIDDGENLWDHPDLQERQEQMVQTLNRKQQDSTP